MDMVVTSKSKSGYVTISIMLCIVILFGCAMPSRAVAATAVVTAGSIIIATIFTAFGLITTAENKSAVTDLVDDCLQDGITDGIFNSSGNLFLHKLTNIFSVPLSVIQWVKTWYLSNQTIQSGGTSQYKTLTQFFDEIGNNFVELDTCINQIDFLIMCGYSYDTIMNNFMISYQNNSGAFLYNPNTNYKYFLYPMSGTVIGRNGRYLSAFYSGSTYTAPTYFLLSDCSYRLSNSNNFSFYNITPNDWLISLDPTVIAIAQTNNHVTSASLDIKYPKWLTRQVVYDYDPLTGEQTQTAVETLPMTATDSISDALDLTQVQAQGASDLGYSDSIDPDNGSGPVLTWYDNIFSDIWTYVTSVFDYCSTAITTFFTIANSVLPPICMSLVWASVSFLLIFGVVKILLK